MISYSDFTKLNLRTARVLSAEPVEGSDKLLRLEVDIGSEKRQLAAGIAKNYKPDKLVGKDIVVLVNLEPKKLLGVLSQGMLLAADTDEGPVLLTLEKEIQPGSEIR